MSELLQFIIVIAFGGLCFGCGYLIATAKLKLLDAPPHTL
jgi:hypothetical protein